MAPDDLMGDPGPAEAMVRRAVEAEREAIVSWIWEHASTHGPAGDAWLLPVAAVTTAILNGAAAIPRRGE